MRYCHFVSLTPCVASAYKMPTCEYFETSHFRREACFLGNHFSPFVLMCLPVHNAALHMHLHRKRYSFFPQANGTLFFIFKALLLSGALTCTFENQAKKMKGFAQLPFENTQHRQKMLREAGRPLRRATLSNYF